MCAGECYTGRVRNFVGGTFSKGMMYMIEARTEEEGKALLKMAEKEGGKHL